MLVDVCHSTSPARAQVYDIVGNRAPILASHVGAYEINPDPYNLQDWEIKRIADGGGLIGVIFMNSWLMPRESKRGINFIVRTIDHLVNVAGIDHVGIGSDFDGFTDPPDDLKDASQLPRLTQRLLASGYHAEEIQKILGGNALRVLMDGWKR
jgi:membrane dipeptidase